MALPGYIKITGEQQGPLEGDVTLADREGYMQVNSFNHGIDVPTNDFGMVSAGRLHLPLTFTKLVDRCTPMLYQAMCTNELLTEVIIDWYRTDGAGMDELYFRHKIVNAQITSMKFIVPEIQHLDTHHMGHTESVTLIYDQIVWSHEIDGVEFEDQWTTA